MKWFIPNRGANETGRGSIGLIAVIHVGTGHTLWKIWSPNNNVRAGATAVESMGYITRCFTNAGICTLQWEDWDRYAGIDPRGTCLTWQHFHYAIKHCNAWTFTLYFGRNTKNTLGVQFCVTLSPNGTTKITFRLSQTLQLRKRATFLVPALINKATFKYTPQTLTRWPNTRSANCWHLNRQQQ